MACGTGVVCFKLNRLLPPLVASQLHVSTAKYVVFFKKKYVLDQDKYELD